MEAFYQQAIEKYQQAIQYGGSHYNLACLFAVGGDNEQALQHLDISLEQKEVSVAFVLKDEDWINFKQDEEFKTLIKKHRK